MTDINIQKKQSFEHDVKSNVCFITLSSWHEHVDLEDETANGHLIERPVTLCDKSNDVYNLPSDITQPQDGTINVWDIFAEKIINVDMDDLLEWSYQALPVEEPAPQLDNKGKLINVEPREYTMEQRSIHKFDNGPENSIDKLKNICHEFECCEGLASKERLQDVMFRRDCDHVSWKILKCVGFTCDCVEDVVHADENKMCEIREGYMNYIRHHRKDAFVELDQLEQETRDGGGTEEDLQDIDTIKQMFRDIPQDLDLSQYKTAKELFECWPSLLLPSPIDSICHTVIDCHCKHEEPHSCCSPDVQHMCKCVDHLDETCVDELKELINQANAQQQTLEQTREALEEELNNGDMAVPNDVIDKLAEQRHNDNEYLLKHMVAKLDLLQAN